MNHIGIQHGTVTQWVALQPIFEVRAGEKGYEGVGYRRDTWWFQEAAETQLRKTLDEISRESRRRRWSKKDTQ